MNRRCDDESKDFLDKSLYGYYSLLFFWPAQEPPQKDTETPPPSAPQTSDGSQEGTPGYYFVEEVPEIDERDFTRYGFTVALNTWIIPGGESGSRSNGFTFANTGNAGIDQQEFAADGAYIGFESRYEKWWGLSLFSVNLDQAFNPFVEGNGEREMKEIANGAGNLLTIVHGDTDGWETEGTISFGFGLGFPDSWRVEIGLGFYHRYTSIDLDNAVVNGAAVNGDVIERDLLYLAMIWDFTIKGPLPFTNDRVWLKLYLRLHPYTHVDEDTDVSANVPLGQGAQDFSEERYGKDSFNAFTFEASLIFHLYKHEKFDIMLEAGYRYFEWKSSDLAEKSILTNNDELQIVDEIHIRQKGPFISLGISF